MAIRFRCQHCHQLMGIAAQFAGTTVKCPACHAELSVPDDGRPAPRPRGNGGSDELSLQSASVDTDDLPSAVDVEEVADEIETDSDQEFVLRDARTDFGEMDLTPMVDVTFLLLIFFMVTASFSLQKSIEVPPPDPDQEGATQSIQSPEELHEHAILVQINERNVISIDHEPVSDPDNLAELLAERKRSEQKIELIIDADAQASHGTVVFVNDSAVEAEFQKIRLAVRADAGSK